MNCESIDPAKKKRFIVSIYEIRQEIVFADEFSDRYVKTVTLSDGTTRTVELTSMIRAGSAGIEFNDTGHRTFMGMLPVRNGGHTNDTLMVRIFDLGDATVSDGATVSRLLPSDTSLTSIPELVPPGFAQGIEILNNDSTPMEFVVGVLSTYLGLSREDATHMMISIHERGGALIPAQSLPAAEKIAAQITEQAARNGHPLICRAVTIA